MSPPLTACKTVVFCGFAALFFSTAAAQTSVPVGGETAIVEPLAGDQVFPAAGIGSAGGFIVWQDTKIDRQGQGIGAQRVGPTLLPEGSAFRVNQRVIGHQQHPSLALLNSGGALVAWDGGAKGDSDIFARLLRADGTFQTADVQVNPALLTGRTNYNFPVRGYKANVLRNLRFRLSNSYRIVRDRNVEPSVAALSDGGAVVAYTGTRRVQTNWMEVVRVERTVRGRTYTNDVPQKFSARQDWMQDVFIQRFDAQGRKIGGEVLVNEYVKYNQRNASVAALPGGGFVVVYVSESSILNFPTVTLGAGQPLKIADVDVFARVFDAAGQPAGAEFKVNTEERLCATPVVSALADGRFTVAWAQFSGMKTNGWDIHARAFTASGAAESAPFLVNSRVARDQYWPRLASVGANQLIVWTSMGQDGSREGVFGQLLSGGVPVGAELAVNSAVDSAQIHPSVTGAGADRFLALWTTFNVGSSFDLASQMYLTEQPAVAGPAAVAVAAGGSGGSIDAGLRMSWSGPVGKLRLNWPTAAGARYQVQTSTDLRNWTNLGAPRSAATAEDSIGIDVLGTAGFFRVVRVP